MVGPRRFLRVIEPLLRLPQDLVCARERWSELQEMGAPLWTALVVFKLKYTFPRTRFLQLLRQLLQTGGELTLHAMQQIRERVCHEQDAVRSQQNTPECTRLHAEYALYGVSRGFGPYYCRSALDEAWKKRAELNGAFGELCENAAGGKNGARYAADVAGRLRGILQTFKGMSSYMRDWLVRTSFVAARVDLCPSTVSEALCCSEHLHVELGETVAASDRRVGRLYRVPVMWILHRRLRRRELPTILVGMVECWTRSLRKVAEGETLEAKSAWWLLHVPIITEYICEVTTRDMGRATWVAPDKAMGWYLSGLHNIDDEPGVYPGPRHGTARETEVDEGLCGTDSLPTLPSLRSLLLTRASVGRR